jgi:cell division protease FtsH
MDDLRKKQFRFSGAYVLLAFAILIVVQNFLLQRAQPKRVPYSEFWATLGAGKLEKAEIQASEIVAQLKGGGGEGQKAERIVTTRLPGIDETVLFKEMLDRGVSFSGKIEETSWLEQFVLGWLLPLGLLGAVYYFMMQRMSKGGPLSLGRNKAKIYDDTQAGKVTFDDVAGVDEAEAELVEVVDFLKNPGKYQALGARIPKGVLLVGPPGTGKTLLARAVAGEAGVPFFSLSGSEFVEMFVGLGAARMRDLFEEAKKRAPCIVFIDELDAIGKSRGGMAAIAHDEREQTLNQLLVEMDGFATAAAVMIVAATNRPEVLDPALLRAGRFDRQVLVDRPDLAGRQAILEVHVRKAKLVPNLDLRTIAQRTAGMVGADLAKVVNESALAAARRGSSQVEAKDFEEAIDRIQLGLKKHGRVMNDDEKQRVAYHEVGHTLVALSVDHGNPVHRVTIIPRSIGALGVTLQLPTEDRYLMTREELRDRLCVMFGGRAAEELFCEDISTGAQNDLERATETARAMVCRFGMSEKLGPATFGRAQSARFLEGMIGEDRNYSEETARLIDSEVKALLHEEHMRARGILEKYREAGEAMTRRLLEVETLDREEIESFLRPVAVAAAVPVDQGRQG